MRFKAFNLSRNNVGFYLTAMTPEVLFKLSRVERVSENPEEGFQRQLEETRANKIAKYFEQKIIPGAIILSAQPEARILYDEEKEELEIDNENGSLLVIDGQHRLFGAYKAHKSGVDNIKLPVCILTNLNLIDEIQYFVDINSTQKGVPKTLRIELTRFLVESESIDDIRLRLFKDLNSEPDSVLCGKMSAEQKGPGYLSHVPFEIAINKVLSTEKMKDLDYDGKKTLLKNYLFGVYENLEEMDATNKISQSAFFQSIFRVFEKACENTYFYKRNFKKESFSFTFESLQKINFDLHSGSNDEAIRNLEKDIIDKLDIDRKSKIPSDLF